MINNIYYCFYINSYLYKRTLNYLAVETPKVTIDLQTLCNSNLLEMMMNQSKSISICLFLLLLLLQYLHPTPITAQEVGKLWQKNHIQPSICQHYCLLYYLLWLLMLRIFVLFNLQKKKESLIIWKRVRRDQSTGESLGKNGQHAKMGNCNPQ